MLDINLVRKADLGELFESKRLDLIKTYLCQKRK